MSSQVSPDTPLVVSAPETNNEEQPKWEFFCNFQHAEGVDRPSFNSADQLKDHQRRVHNLVEPSKKTLEKRRLAQCKDCGQFTKQGSEGFAHHNKKCWERGPVGQRGGPYWVDASTLGLEDPQKVADVFGTSGKCMPRLETRRPVNKSAEASYEKRKARLLKASGVEDPISVQDDRQPAVLSEGSSQANSIPIPDDGAESQPASPRSSKKRSHASMDADGADESKRPKKKARATEQNAAPTSPSRPCSPPGATPPGCEHSHHDATAPLSPGSDTTATTTHPSLPTEAGTPLLDPFDEEPFDFFEEEPIDFFEEEPADLFDAPLWSTEPGQEAMTPFLVPEEAATLFLAATPTFTPAQYEAMKFFGSPYAGTAALYAAPQVSAPAPQTPAPFLAPAATPTPWAAFDPVEEAATFVAPPPEAPAALPYNSVEYPDLDPGMIDALNEAYQDGSLYESFWGNDWGML